MQQALIIHNRITPLDGAEPGNYHLNYHLDASALNRDYLSQGWRFVSATPFTKASNGATSMPVLATVPPWSAILVIVEKP